MPPLPSRPPHAKSPRAKPKSRRRQGQSPCPAIIRTRGARATARGGWKCVAWRDCPRPTGEGRPRLPGARPALLQAKLDASPGRSRRVRTFGDRTPPSPTQAGGMTHQARQGLVRPAFAVTPQALGGRPARAGLRIKRRRWQPLQGTVGGVQANAGSSAPSQAATGSGHSREMPLPKSTSIRQAPRADRGLASQASGPRVRPPPTGTHRLPPARAPSAPAIRSGRKVRIVWHGWRGCGKSGGVGGGVGFQFSARQICARISRPNIMGCQPLSDIKELEATPFIRISNFR